MFVELLFTKKKYLNSRSTVLFSRGPKSRHFHTVSVFFSTPSMLVLRVPYCFSFLTSFVSLFLLAMHEHCHVIFLFFHTCSFFATTCFILLSHRASIVYNFSNSLNSFLRHACSTASRPKIKIKSKRKKRKRFLSSSSIIISYH